MISLGMRHHNSMLIISVRKIGRSLGVILPKQAISRLRVHEGDHLLLSEGLNGTYQITPRSSGFLRKLEKAEDIIKR
jgi:antitoxin component of MazEF toxin-antitoxin module